MLDETKLIQEKMEKLGVLMNSIDQIITDCADMNPKNAIMGEKYKLIVFSDHEKEEWKDLKFSDVVKRLHYKSIPSFLYLLKYVRSSGISFDCGFDFQNDNICDQILDDLSLGMKLKLNPLYIMNFEFKSNGFYNGFSIEIVLSFENGELIIPEYYLNGLFNQDMEQLVKDLEKMNFRFETGVDYKNEIIEYIKEKLKTVEWISFLQNEISKKFSCEFFKVIK